MADTFNFTDADSGYVQLQAITYSIGTGYGNCTIQKIPSTGTDKRTVQRFDTSSISDSATVTKVEWFRRDSLAQSLPFPNATTFRIGSWCGAALDASANDYNATGALDCGIDVYNSYLDGDWIDLADGGYDPTSYVSLTGITDIQIRDTHSIKETSQWSFNTSKSKCQLRVTYTVPATTY
jgi:hypothetical protein